MRLKHFNHYFSTDQTATSSIPKILQICLLQLSHAIAFVLIHSTLNRVMIVEFGIAAWIVGAVMGFHNLLAFVRPMIGLFSDTHAFLGYRRTPIIILGNLLVAAGVIGSIYGAIWMSHAFYPGLALTLFASLIYGIGINVAGTMFYALLTDNAGENYKSIAVSLGWIVLISGSILASAVAGYYLDEFSESQLISLFWVGAIASMLITWMAVLGSEKRNDLPSAPNDTTHPKLELRSSLKKLAANQPVYRFFSFMFVTVIAIQGQDVILEPFGAHIFGMNIAETTKLTQVWGAGTIFGIVVLGLFFVNRIGKKRTTYLGCTLSAIGFLIISASAWFDVTVFKSGVFLLGLGNGALTVGSLTMMMDMTTKANTGLFMGLWGLAQAIPNFLANAVGGAIRDISLFFTQNQYVGYTTAFAIEIIGLFIAILILRTVDVAEFKKNSAQLFYESISNSD
ncbi:PUCC protein [Chloroherpeton thalassium ATCC 35110]|uniref:PUCC protein n=1 Tax=Chloroherpeton thalassium (strain ATCC 35110 / GB-78) TaxID=517418 RepID=B3QYN0_CHLT3|nr:BCD family MFS transporter [Chloroherpeton thalassium]ACF15103.1 PUCC protein [Chloroherpeton thalassium ATCC 35110]